MKRQNICVPANDDGNKHNCKAPKLLFWHVVAVIVLSRKKKKKEKKKEKNRKESVVSLTLDE